MDTNRTMFLENTQAGINEQADIVSDQVARMFSIIVLVIMCQIVCVFGTISNILNMIVFVRIGFTDRFYIGLMALAISDFGSCFILIWHTIAVNPWFQELDLPWERRQISYLTSSCPHVVFAKMTTMLTAFISLEKCLCVLLPLQVKTIITRTLVKSVVIFTFLYGLLNLLLLYSTNWYAWKFYPDQNKTIIGLVFSDNREDIESVYYPILQIAIPLICFAVVAVSTALLVFALKKNSKWKQQVVRSINFDKNDEKNQSVSSKEMKVTKMVVTICIFYIICFTPNVVIVLLMTTDRSVSINGTNKNLLRVLGVVSFFLESLNSACNIVIYYANSSVYKSTFKQVFGRSKDVKKK